MLKFYSVKELADLFKVSEINIRNLINENELEAFKVGREWRISEDALARYIDANKNK